MRHLLAGLGMLLLSSIAVTAQESHWAIIASVSITGHDQIPYMAKVFKTDDECHAYLLTPEFLSTFDTLTKYEQSFHAGEGDFTITAECVLLDR